MARHRWNSKLEKSKLLWYSFYFTRWPMKNAQPSISARSNQELMMEKYPAIITIENLWHKIVFFFFFLERKFSTHTADEIYVPGMCFWNYQGHSSRVMHDLWKENFKAHKCGDLAVTSKVLIETFAKGNPYQLRIKYVKSTLDISGETGGSSLYVKASNYWSLNAAHVYISSLGACMYNSVSELIRLVRPYIIAT